MQFYGIKIGGCWVEEMRQPIVKTLLLLALLSAGSYEPKDGDIIFQTSLSSQSKAIQFATDSPYSHVGVVFLRENKPFVLEAVRTVRFTPLKRWIARGKEKSYLVMRSKQELTVSQIRKLRLYGKLLKGRRYDQRFLWSDYEIYCSELVWKLYNGAGLVLTRTKTMRDYNFNDPAVRKLLKQRWGRELDWNEVVVAPADLLESPLLSLAYHSQRKSK